MSLAAEIDTQNALIKKLLRIQTRAIIVSKPIILIVLPDFSTAHYCRSSVPVNILESPIVLR